MSLLTAAFQAWLGISWHAACLLAPLVLLRTLTRRLVPARVWMWVWIVVGVRLLLPVSLPVAWSPFSLLPSLPFGAAAAIPPIPASVPEEGGPSSAADASSASVAAGDTTASGLAARPSGDPWAWASGAFAGAIPLQATASFWLLGALVLAVLRLWSIRRFARRVRDTGRPPSEAVARSLSIQASHAFDAAVAPLSRRILVTPAVTTPALHGFLRPHLLFPPGLLERLTPDELRLVLAHERAHAESRDLWTLSLLHAAALLHWFNPLAWLLLRRAREDCELACDERVLDRLSHDQSAAYGSALLRIVQLTATPDAPFAAPPAGIAMAADGRQLHNRIAMIASHRPARRSRTVLAGLLFASLASLSFTREADGPATITPASTSIGAAVAEGTITFRPHTVRVPEGAPSFTYRRFAYDASTDRLDTLFPGGVVATLGERTVTVADVRRELEPLVPQLQREAKDQADFDRLVGRLQNDVISNLLRRHLLVQRFRGQSAQETDAVVSPEAVENRLAEILRLQFDNSRPRLLAHLEARGLTEAAFRREVEEDLIWAHMRRQERHADAATKQAAEASRPKGPQVRLRILQLNRKTAADTDDALRARAAVILARHGQGESFARLAREFDESRRRDHDGDWGWQSQTDLKPTFWEVVAALPKGSASAPVIVPEGCFILFAEDWR